MVLSGFYKLLGGCEVQCLWVLGGLGGFASVNVACSGGLGIEKLIFSSHTFLSRSKTGLSVRMCAPPRFMNFGDLAINPFRPHQFAATQCGPCHVLLMFDIRPGSRVPCAWTCQGMSAE